MFVSLMVPFDYQSEASSGFLLSSVLLNEALLPWLTDFSMLVRFLQGMPALRFAYFLDRESQTMISDHCCD